MGAIAGSLTFEGEKLESPGPSVVGHFEFPQAHAARWGGSFIDWGSRRKARHGGHESDGGVQAPAPAGRNELAHGRKPWVGRGSQELSPGGAAPGLLGLRSEPQGNTRQWGFPADRVLHPEA